jgi:transcriptional regulator with XRE-family HTH domain
VVSRLKYERVNRAISLEQLYRQSGVRPIDISLIERLRLVPTPLQLAQLASVLDIPGSLLLLPVSIVVPEDMKTEGQVHT